MPQQKERGPVWQRPEAGQAKIGARIKRIPWGAPRPKVRIKRVIRESKVK